MQNDDELTARWAEEFSRRDLKQFARLTGSYCNGARVITGATVGEVLDGAPVQLYVDPNLDAGEAVRFIIDILGWLASVAGGGVDGKVIH